MPLYEHVFLTRQDASTQQVEDLTAQFKAVIEQMGGKVAKTEQWGVKTLAYRLRKNRKAHFTMFNIEAPPAALNEIERQQRLSEDVLRYLTVRVRDHEEGPSAMMRKVDRDRERDDRGFGFRDRDRGGFRDRDRGEHLAPRRRSESDGDVPNADPAAFLSPPQDLPVLRRQCAEDRLQGRQAVATLRVRARQDRAESHYGGVRQEAAGAGTRHQARPLPRIVALRNPLAEGQRAHDAGRAEQNGRKRGVDLPHRPAMVGTQLMPSLTADEAGQLKMMQIVLVGLGAGAAAALLLASVVSGSIAAIFLFYLAPLPILIAALGWNHIAGLIAAAVATAAITVLSGTLLIAVPVIAFGSWWLGYCALLARPASNRGAGALEWYPPGRLVLWAAVIGSLTVAAAVPNFGTDQQSVQAALRKAYEGILRDQSLIDMLVVAVPPGAAVFSTVTNLFNLWLAARVVKISGRLRRPWPDLASLTLPASTTGLLAAAIAGTEPRGDADCGAELRRRADVRRAGAPDVPRHRPGA